MNQVFARIAHPRTGDGVVEQVETLILDGVLRPGEKLPGERDLARQLEISRPILRDALKTLEARGLVDTRAGGRTQVADVIGELFAPPVMDLIARRPEAAADYLEYRREIEAITAEMAARRATPDDIALLDAIMRRMDKAHQRGRFDEEAAIDVEFHGAVGECAHNIVLLHTLRSCYRLLSDGVFLNRSLIYSRPAAREMLLSQHRAIHQTIVDGDPAAARQAARDHIDYVAQAMAEAERSGEWQRISRLRRRQRSGDEAADPARARVAETAAGKA